MYLRNIQIQKLKIKTPNNPQNQLNKKQIPLKIKKCINKKSQKEIQISELKLPVFYFFSAMSLYLLSFCIYLHFISIIIIIFIRDRQTYNNNKIHSLFFHFNFGIFYSRGKNICHIINSTQTLRGKFLHLVNFLLLFIKFNFKNMQQK